MLPFAPGGGGYDPEGNKSDYTSFTKWLQCYYQDGMNNMVDHNGRTIWFKGPAGPMVPKGMVYHWFLFISQVSGGGRYVRKCWQITKLME